MKENNEEGIRGEITFSQMKCISSNKYVNDGMKGKQISSGKNGILGGDEDKWNTWHSPGDQMIEETKNTSKPWKHILERVKKSKAASGWSLE